MYDQADKRYQLADWRVRPLAPELLHYARSDTHYLLYIHDRLKQELQAVGDEVSWWQVAEGIGNAVARAGCLRAG